MTTVPAAAGPTLNVRQAASVRAKRRPAPLTPDSFRRSAHRSGGASTLAPAAPQSCQYEATEAGPSRATRVAPFTTRSKKHGAHHGNSSPEHSGWRVEREDRRSAAVAARQRVRLVTSVARAAPGDSVCHATVTRTTRGCAVSFGVTFRSTCSAGTITEFTDAAKELQRGESLALGDRGALVVCGCPDAASGAEPLEPSR